MFDNRHNKILSKTQYAAVVGLPSLCILLIAVALAARVDVAQAIPVITTTKNDTLVVDLDGDNFAGPGDTIRYTTMITQSGTTNASNVVFQDTIDPNTTLVAGSLHTTPIARNDSYASLGNVGITVPAGSGVLANDADPDGDSLSVIPSAGATANGGVFANGADGSFAYLPPAGFKGADSFAYVIQDSDGNQDPATVFITVTEMVWFIDNAASSGGDGRSSSPFNSIADFNAIQTGLAPNAKDGDIIFIHSGSGNYTNGIILRDNQYLFGQGVSDSIGAIAGITIPPFSNHFQASGARPTLTTVSGDGVVLGQNNTLRGFNVGNTAGVGISDDGGTVGTLTASEIAISGTGGGIEVDNGGTIAVTLDSLSASGGSDEGIDLKNVTGSFGVTTASSVLNMTGVPAVIIDGAGGLTLAVSLQSISSTNAAHGISIQGTTGSFIVTGTGNTPGSGGTLSGHTAEGIYLNNATNIALSNMAIDQSATANTQGIDASNVTGLSISGTTVTAGSGSSNALLGQTVTNLSANSSVFDGGGGSVPNVDGVRITNLLGTNTINNSTFRNGKDINLLVENSTNSGGVDSLSIFGGVFSNSAGGDHLQMEASGTANLKLVVDAGIGNTTFSGTSQDGIQLEAQGSATFEAIITGATFNNTLGSTVNLGAAGNGHLIARVHDLSGLTSGSTNVVNIIGFDTSYIEATVENNTINLGGTAFNGVRVIQEGNGTLTTRIANNSITGVANERGILVQGRSGTGGNGTLNATINDNMVNISGGLSLDGIEVTSGSSAGGDTNTICLNMFGNNSTSANSDGYFLRQRAGSTFRLQDFPSGTAANWVTTTKSNVGTVSTSGTFVNAPAACATPTVPVAFTPGDAHLVQGPGIPGSEPNSIGYFLSQVADRTKALLASLVENTTQVARAFIESASVRTAHASGETVNITLGQLDPGQVVMIQFDVSLDNPQNPAFNTQVCNQGQVSGDNFADTLTDDPAVGGAADPTCTSLAPGTIIIFKDQSPDGGSSFGFTSTIPGSSSFNVTGDSSRTIPNLSPGSYIVTENLPAIGFFALTGLSCDDGGSAAPSTTDKSMRTATINLEPGETVTCTFTNEQQARIEVVKVVDATPNGETFDLLIDGDVKANAVGDGGTTGKVGVSLGSHTVSEAGDNLGSYNTEIECVEQSGIVLAQTTGTALSIGPLNPGDDVVCTITNTHKRGSLEVVKNLVPGTDTGSFNMRIDITAHVATGGNGTTTGEQSVPIGTHLVGETGNGVTDLDNYTTSISCKDNNGTGVEVAATPNGAFAWDVTVNEDEDIVCTITNERKSTILVQKAVSQGDPDNPGQTFTLDIRQRDVILGSLSTITAGSPPVGLGGLTPGNYTVNEINLAPGWSLDDISCINNLGHSTFGTFTPGDSSLEVMLAPGSVVLCTFTNVFQQAPTANDDSYMATEDIPLYEPAPGVLANDTDPNGDPLTAVLDTGPNHGTLTLNSDGSFGYAPDPNYCGPDSFTYHANDGQADSSVAAVYIIVECVDDPPIVSVDVASQTVQYSDIIRLVTVTASDIDSTNLIISDNAPSNLSTSGGCTPDTRGGTSCYWTLTGQVLVGAGMYDIVFTVSDAINDVTTNTQVMVTPEDAEVSFASDNPVAVPVDGDGSDSSLPFTLKVHVQETPEIAANTAPGDINLAQVSITLFPVGPGSPTTVPCVSPGAVAAYDYGAVLTVACDFSGVPVNAYIVTATAAGGYYTGSNQDTLFVYDPSLGFTTGGGWFYWPGTDHRTNFSYTVKYNKKSTQIQGNLVVIQHLPDGSTLQIKSEPLDGLALGEEGTFGWAAFSGKATYNEPGNYTFTAYVEDHGEPGDMDRFWLEVRDKDGNLVGAFSMDMDPVTNAATLAGGNLAVPHQNNGTGKNQ